MPEDILFPENNCSLCPRLLDFRQHNRVLFPDKHNAPVPAFGQIGAYLAIIGLAPGLKGANFSGRPFTGDYAGELLYATLIKYGFAKGRYKARPEDGLELVNCRITNSVKCVPPENKPTNDEIKTCLRFLKSELAAMHNLKMILSLGMIAHQSVLRAFNLKLSDYKFGHGRVHHLPDGIRMINSYHCSRYNTQTGRLTPEMFEDVVSRCASQL